MPLRALALLLRFSSDWAVGSSWALSAGAKGSALTPSTMLCPTTFCTGAMAWKPGRSSVKSWPVLARNGRIVGSVAIAVSSAAGDLEIDSWMNGRETRANAANVVSRSAKSWPWISATGATSAAVADSEETKFERPVLGSARFRITGVETLDQGLQLPDRFVQVHPTTGQGVAELEQIRLDRGPGRRVEHVEDLVDLHRLGAGGGQRHGRAGRKPAVRAAAVDLQVLQAERGPSPDHDRRVLGEWIDVLVEVHVDLRHLAGAAPGRVIRAGGVGHVLGRDAGDLADPLAADPDLVARHHAGGVGELGGELVGGYEGQPVVRLVGEEDRHHDDEHGDRADEGRAGRQAADAPAPHAPPPSRNCRNIEAWRIETACLPDCVVVVSSGVVVVSSGVVVVVPEPLSEDPGAVSP